MKLGDRVTFSRYITRGRDGTSSFPLLVNAPHSMEGIVIGMSCVYNCDFYGGVPELYGRRDAVMVATSLFKRYKVFPEDASVVEPETALAQDVPTLASSALAVSTRMTLRELVMGELNDLIASDAEFTAWDVTRNIRERCPDRSIPHSSARVLTHEMMNDIVSVGMYSVETRRFPNGRAQVYTP